MSKFHDLPILHLPEGEHAPSDTCSHVSKETNRIIQRLQVVTVCWMLVECSVALSASWRACSPALLAFGADSSVELMSATVVLLQFTSIVKVSTERAARLAGILLLFVAAIIAIVSVSAMLFKVVPNESKLGVGVTLVALAIMPILSRAKRRQANETSNRAMAADAVQSATCAYLAGLTLLGVILNATFHIRWVDPLAALAAIPILVIEARRAFRGQVCGSC
ncbi:MAG: cation transporter [Acidobacteriaceae bacterium]